MLVEVDPVLTFQQVHYFPLKCIEEESGRKWNNSRKVPVPLNCIVLE